VPFSSGSVPRFYKEASQPLRTILREQFSCRIAVESLQGGYGAGLRWPPACKDVSPEEEEGPTLEVVTEQPD
jgi:hypothetical protein